MAQRPRQWQFAAGQAAQAYSVTVQRLIDASVADIVSHHFVADNLHVEEQQASLEAAAEEAEALAKIESFLH
jgi:hypothetical protein